MMRYVYYMSLITALPAPRRLWLRRVIMKPVPDYAVGVTPSVQIFNANIMPYESVYSNKWNTTFEKVSFEIPLDINIPVEGDVCVKVFNQTKIIGVHTSLFLLRFSFNTSFVPPNFILQKWQLDGTHSGPLYDEKIRKSFSVEVLFTQNQNDPLPTVLIETPVTEVPANTVPPDVNRDTKYNRVYLSEATNRVQAATQSLTEVGTQESVDSTLAQNQSFSMPTQQFSTESQPQYQSDVLQQLYPSIQTPEQTYTQYQPGQINYQSENQNPTWYRPT